MGSAVGAVGVQILQAGWHIVYSDSNGVFVTRPLPPNEYDLVFQRFGWAGASRKVRLGLTDVELPPVIIAFGDLNEDGVVDLRDAAQLYDRLGETVDNTNRYLDLNQNLILDSWEFDYLLEGIGFEGKKVEEWAVSSPDFVTYVPQSASSPDATNQQYLVQRLPSGRLFGIWTQAFQESSPNQSIVCHWSDDDGSTWSRPLVIDGPATDGRIASWGFSVYAPRFNRIYVFYNKDIGTRIYQTGEMLFKYSDDEGKTWSQAFRISFRRGEYSPSDSSLPPSWWVYQDPIIVGGKPLVGFTEILSRPPELYYSTEIRFFSFENILTEADPRNLLITTYPEGPHGLRGSYRANSLRSTLQEPSLVQLSDGRLMCVMRSGQGFPYYALSSDTGRTWTTPSPLRYGDGSPTIDQPLASCPLYKMSDSLYMLVFHNNTGDANGGYGPADWKRNRTPAFITIGRENLRATQPIEFSRPVRILENYARPWGPQQRTEIATYPSLTNQGDFYVLWYPDRKHFLLGKKLPKPITKLLEEGE